MTDQRLRDLLHEQVSDLQSTDLGAAAWSSARRTRQRRAAVVASVAVVAVVVAGVLAIGPGGDDDRIRPTEKPTTTEPTGPSVQAEPGSDYRGAKTWWAPSVADEADLPQLKVTALPEEINLAPGLPAHPAGVRAVAVYELRGDSPDPGRVVIVGTDGASYSLDVGNLEPVADEEGNALSVLSAESLAPDGKTLFFRQQDELAVYDLTLGAWGDPLPTGLAEDARWIDNVTVWVPDQLGAQDGHGLTYLTTDARTSDDTVTLPPVWDADEPYGVAREGAGGRVAQAEFLADPVTGPEGGPQAGLDAVAARTGGDGILLLVMSGDGEHWKGCCPVIGWLDEETVLLQSGSNASRILAWRVGTPDLRRVSRLIGWEPGVEAPIGTFVSPVS